MKDFFVSYTIADESAAENNVLNGLT